MVSKDLCSLPDEVFGRILVYVPIDNGLKDFALTCSRALKVASPILYRTIGLELEGAEMAPNDDGDFVYTSKYQDVELRTVEAILETSSKTLGYVRVLDVCSPRFSPHGHMSLGITQARLKRDNFMLRAIVRRLAEVDRLRIIRLPAHIELSLMSLEFIFRSLPSLRLLRAGNIALVDNTDPEASVTFASEGCKRRINLKWLELVNFENEAIPVILQTLRRCGHSLRGLNIQPVSGLNAHNWQIPNDDGTPRFISQNRGFDFKQGPDSLVNQLKEEDREIRLSALEELWIAAMDDYRIITDVLGHLITDCKKLTHVRLEFCYYPENILSRLVEANAGRLECLRMLKCSWDNELTPAPLDAIIRQLAPLKTLVMSNLNNWDMTSVFYHRQSLKQLWLQCHASEQQCQLQFGCHMTADLFCGAPQYQFTSESWPYLEELAVQYVGWDKIPIMRTLRALRILSDLCLKSDCETMEEYTANLRAYVERLWTHSLAHYGHTPSLELMIGAFDGTEVYFIIKSENLKPLIAVYPQGDFLKVFELMPRPFLLDNCEDGETGRIFDNRNWHEYMRSMSRQNLNETFMENSADPKWDMF